MGAAVAQTAADMKGAADEEAADMTVAADVGAVATTKKGVVTAPQTHTPSDLTNALTRMLLTA